MDPSHQADRPGPPTETPTTRTTETPTTQTTETPTTQTTETPTTQAAATAITTTGQANQEPQTQGRSEVHFWSTVRDHLRNPGTNPAPIAKCPVCLEAELAIRGIPQSTPDKDTVMGLYLFCGHMICYDCHLSWHDSCWLQGTPLTCPMCRVSLHFPAPDCRHPVPAVIIPAPRWDLEEDDPARNEISYLDRMPPTIREGGFLPPWCANCRPELWGGPPVVLPEGFDRPNWPL
ncbi:hypothetical protein VTK56DRAFT_3784 [Thermocarpiscus australiensis]